MKFFLKVLFFALLAIIIIITPFLTVYIATANAIPGDKIYPIKMFFEERIDQVTAFSPDARAYFAVMKVTRRHQEVITLAENSKDITAASQSLIDQMRESLFEIQAISNISTRINTYSQYQTLLAQIKVDTSILIDLLNQELEKRGSQPEKTFSLDQYVLENDKLTVSPKKFVLKGITEKDPVAETVIRENIRQLEEIQQTTISLQEKK